jgi:phosphoribosylamine---glycine ligase
VGGSAGGDRLELDREYAQELFASVGMRTVPSTHFANATEAAKFVRANGGRWVIKQNGNTDKMQCYVGKLEDGSDVLDLLELNDRRKIGAGTTVNLERVLFGAELAVCRYFNGERWTGPIELTQEHKPLFSYGVGPNTYEMGTLMWYDEDEGNPLFRETLALLTSHLQEVGFRGDFDINCIVNEEGAFPLEATARFGWPATQLQIELHDSPWGEFLKAVADGRDYPLSVHQGYGIVVLLAVPPFPFSHDARPSESGPNGLRVHLPSNITEEERTRVHFEEVEVRTDANGREEYVICSDTGYVLHVTGRGQTVQAAQDKAYRLLERIVVPRMYYRHDIGQRFLDRDRDLLMKWGYL